MGAMEFLGNWIFHFDRFDLLVKGRKRVTPKSLDERQKFYKRIRSQTILLEV